MKRIACLLAAFCLLFGTLPLTVSAENPNVTITFYAGLFDPENDWNDKVVKTVTEDLDAFTSCALPEDPVNEGYRFVCWMLFGKNAQGETVCRQVHEAIFAQDVEQMAAETNGNKIIRLYGSWERTTTTDAGATLILDATGGQLSGQDRATYIVAQQMASATQIWVAGRYPNPERSGFAFAGWYRNSDCDGEEIFRLEDAEFFETVEDEHGKAVNWEKPCSVTLYAKWVPTNEKRTITITPSAGGTVTADKAEATAGETITLTATPDEGYELYEWRIFDGLGQNLLDEGLTMTGNSFEMPGMKVRVVGLFRKLGSDGTTLEVVDSRGSVTLSQPVPDTTTLRLMPSNDETALKALQATTPEIFRVWDIALFDADNQHLPITGAVTVQLVLDSSLPIFGSYQVALLKNGVPQTPFNARFKDGVLSFETTDLLAGDELGDVALLGFSSPLAMPGDADGDEKITTTDARLALQFTANKITEDKLDVVAADVDNDLKVTTTDARKILQYTANKITSFL